MRNFMIIALILIAMGYMFTILFDRYQTIVKDEDKKSIQLQNKKTKE